MEETNSDVAQRQSVAHHQLAKKRDLELKIKGLLGEFTRETGLIVDDVSIEATYVRYGTVTITARWP